MRSFSANTAQKIKFSIKDFFSKCGQIRRNLNTPMYLTGIYLLKVNNRNTSTIREISSKSTINAQERLQWLVVSLLLTLNRFYVLFWCFNGWLCIPAGRLIFAKRNNFKSVFLFFWVVCFCCHFFLSDRNKTSQGFKGTFSFHEILAIVSILQNC